MAQQEKVKNICLTFVLAFSLILVACSDQKDIASKTLQSVRWYSESQVALGGNLYQTHCINCHLEDAKGTTEWKKTLSDGSYPPPPLNGSAHAWHHSTDVLMTVIQQGGIPYGGKMPPFKDILSEKEQLAVIAYFQSFWPDDIYDLWETKVEHSKQ